MSHIVEIQTQVRDPVAIRAACQRLKLAEPVQGTVKLFTSQATGWSVQLPGWNFPVVFDVGTGEVKFDNYNGKWGDPEKLGLLLQMYAVEKARIEARRQGHTVSEQQLQDGSIKLVVQIGGAA